MWHTERTTCWWAIRDEEAAVMLKAHDSQGAASTGTPHILNKNHCTSSGQSTRLSGGKLIGYHIFSNTSAIPHVEQTKSSPSGGV